MLDADTVFALVVLSGSPRTVSVLRTRTCFPSQHSALAKHHGEPEQALGYQGSARSFQNSLVDRVGPCLQTDSPVPLEIHGSPYVIKAHPLPCGMQKVPCILAWPGLFSLLQ